MWMSHGDKVTELLPGFVCTASLGSAPITVMANAESGCLVCSFTRGHSYKGRFRVTE